MIRQCSERGVSFSIVPRLFEVSVERVTVEHIGGLPLVTMHPADPNGVQFLIKHVMDRVVTAVLLVLLAPILLASAVALRVSLGGPVLFRQRRIGRDGKEFEMLKFRTMHGSPERDGEGDADWAAALGELTSDDPRCHESVDRRTRLGRLLRRFSIDELPQFWNVLKGDMSLIGPRPERVRYARRFERAVHRYGDRHRVKSGITGWAQVNGLRGQTSLAERVEWDNYYIENWSLWLDFKIAAMTVAAILKGHSE
jgi:exopolysaccharide biosynthesis polyprenyl glycosylphosphotransferase